MSKYLADKVIVVTGAGSGFGKLIAEKCAAGGAKVVGIDINDENLSKAFEDISAAGMEGLAQVADVTNLPHVKEAIQQAIDINIKGVVNGIAAVYDQMDAVVHVIDQPWGISLSDVTVRASGENYVY